MFNKPNPHRRRLIGDDFKTLANEVAVELEAQHRTREAREREAEALRRELPSRTFFLKVSHVLGRNGDPIEVETCERLPIVGHMRATGRDYEHARSNLWYGIAVELEKRGYAPDWDTARAEAVERFSFVPSMADSLGVSL